MYYLVSLVNYCIIYYYLTYKVDYKPIKHTNMKARELQNARIFLGSYIDKDDPRYFVQKDQDTLRLIQLDTTLDNSAIDCIPVSKEQLEKANVWIIFIGKYGCDEYSVDEFFN